MDNNVYFYLSLLEWIFNLAADTALMVMAFAAAVVAYKFKKA